MAKDKHSSNKSKFSAIEHYIYQKDITLNEHTQLSDVDISELRNITQKALAGETATFYSNKITRWLMIRGFKFKDFGFKYEIKAS
jgi:hypothetical protein